MVLDDVAHGDNGTSMVVEQEKQLVKISLASTPSSDDDDDDSYGDVRVNGSVAGNTDGTGTAVADVAGDVDDDDDEGVMMNVVHYVEMAMEETKKVMTNNDDCCGCDEGTVAVAVVAPGVSMVSRVLDSNGKCTAVVENDDFCHWYESSGSVGYGCCYWC